MLSALFSFLCALHSASCIRGACVETRGGDGEAVTGMSRKVSRMERFCPQWELVT